MDILGEKQKTKIIADLGFEEVEADCFIKKITSDRIVLQTFPNQKTDFSEFNKDCKLEVKVFTPKGIVIFRSNIVQKISDKELEILFDKKFIVL